MIFLPREVHHFALLIAYGASIINPYVSFAVIAGLVDEGKMAFFMPGNLK